MRGGEAECCGWRWTDVFPTIHTSVHVPLAIKYRVLGGTEEGETSPSWDYLGLDEGSSDFSPEEFEFDIAETLARMD